MALYTVRRGDNLTSIAKKFGTSATALIAANKAKVGANPDRIFSGTVLAVPTRAANAGRSDDGVSRSGKSAPVAKGRGPYTATPTKKPGTTARTENLAKAKARASAGTRPSANANRSDDRVYRGGSSSSTTGKPKPGRASTRVDNLNKARARANGK